MMTLDPTIRVLIVALVAGLFVVAAISKFAQPKRFSEILGNYHLVPVALLPVVSILVPTAEFLIAILIIVAPTIGAVTAAGTLVIYGAALASVDLRGLELDDCGCSWGPGQVRQHHWPLVVRNGLLAVMALVPIVFVSGPAPTGFEIINGIAAACFAGCLWAGFSTLVANRQRMKAAGHV